MSEEHTGDYLWDKSGDPDPEVQRLEALLAPFAHDGRAFGGRPGRRLGGLGWPLVVVAAVATAAAVMLAIVWGFDTDQLKLVRASDQAQLRQGHKLVTTATEVLELEDGLSEITVAPGSVLWVDRLKQDITQLRLERGELHAFVSADAKERFFQVQTPATNCVDLGCMYTLTVDQNENAKVVVEMGRVAFEDSGREVVVPAEATCVATKLHGAGTPRHTDTPEVVVQFLDQFDARRGIGADAVAVRLRLARRILAALAGDDLKYSLIAWHFLQDPAYEIGAAAAEWLVENCPGQKPAGFVVPRGPIDERDRKSWRANLEEFWGW